MLTSIYMFIYTFTRHCFRPLRLRQRWPVLILLLFISLGSVEWATPSYAGTTLPGKIRINKVTEPAGSETEFAFQFRSSASTRTFSLAHGEQRTFRDLTPGAGYEVSETVPSGWMLKSATCNDGSPINAISVRENKTTDCTFVNVQLGTIIVKKVTEPADDLTTSFNFSAGGGLSPATFVLKNGGSRSFTNLVPGQHYSLAENVPTGWVQSNVTCSDGSPATKIDVAAGETVTCTFVNKQRGKLVVRKITNPSPDRTNSSFAFTTESTLTPNSFSLKNGETYTFDNLAPRAGYQLRELVPTHWQLSESSCSNGTPITNIRIDPGATVTCTFTNLGTLIDLKLTKTDGGITAEPGDTIVYTLHYRNDGTKNALNGMLTEQVPDHTTFAGSTANAPQWSCATGAPAGTLCQLAIGTLAGGTQGQVPFRVKVNNALPAALRAIDNTARLGYSGVATAAQSSTSSPVKAAAGLTLHKDDGGVEARPGGLILYTLRYKNEGNQAASGVLITETVPLHTTFVASNPPWSCPVGATAGTRCLYEIGTVGAGQAGEVTFQVQVAGALPAGLSTIDNLATIGSATQPNSDTGTEQSEVRAAPDLSVVITGADQTVAPGGLIRYQVAYANSGGQTATNVRITANLPADTTFVAAESTAGWSCSTGSCTFVVGSLNSGASSTINWTVKVARPLPPDRMAIVTTVRITDDGVHGPDPVPANNEATASTPIVEPGTMMATKRATLVIDENNDGQAGPGDTLEYLVTLQNQRGMAVRNVRFTDTLPTVLALVPGLTTSQGVIVAGSSVTDQQVQVDVGTIAADSTVTIRFRVGIRTPLPASVESVANQGTVESSDFSTRQTDDPATATPNDATITPLVAKAAVEASLADFLFADANSDARVSVGDTLIYRLTIRNRGDKGSAQLQVRVPLAENVILVPNSVTTSMGIIRAGNEPEDRIVRVDIGEVAGGGEARITFRLQIVPVPASTTVSHQALITALNVTGQSGIPSDDPDTELAADATVTFLDQAIVTLQHLYLPVIATTAQ